MATKGNETKNRIKREAYKLFASKGFKDVTMSDICKETGLSRGGLYRHYSSTAEIFKEIVSKDYPVDERIGNGERATIILISTLDEIEEEILRKENSLSLAIYEYAMIDTEGTFVEIERQTKQRWIALIEYGIQTCEFAMVNPEEIAEMIMYYYQGLRMWSRVVTIDIKSTGYYKNAIKKALGI